jgi:hypothetical protein
LRKGALAALSGSLAAGISDELVQLEGIMKLPLASAFIAAFLAAPAMAQDLDFSKITCGEFISAPKDEVSTILVWLEGFYTKGRAAPIMYQEKTMNDAKALAEYCNAHGDDDIIKAADTVMPIK